MRKALPLVVVLDSTAHAEFRLLVRKEKEAAVQLGKLFRRAESVGWDVAIKGDLIKVLDYAAQVGEIRRAKPGSAHRAIFFWHDDDETRSLHVTRIAKKSILKDARLQTLIDAAIARREDFLDGKGTDT